MKRKGRIWFLMLVVICAVIAGIVGFRSLAREMSLFYTSVERDGGFAIAVNPVGGCCFVGEYLWEGGEQGGTITVPDACGERPVTQLGGYFGRGVPTPFTISLAGLMNAPTGSEYCGVFMGDIAQFELDEAYTVVTVPFVLNLGANLREVKFVDRDSYYPHINEDGSVTFYHPVVWVNCAEENPYFYSKEGRLYDRKTDELVAAFAYE